MSQHIFRCEIKQGGYAQIAMGWDKPLQIFYCVVSPLEDTQLGDPLYCNLDDPNALDHSLVYFCGILFEQFAVTLPNDMIAAVYDDRDNNAVNRKVYY